MTMVLVVWEEVPESITFGQFEADAKDLEVLYAVNGKYMNSDFPERYEDEFYDDDGNVVGVLKKVMDNQVTLPLELTDTVVFHCGFCS